MYIFIDSAQFCKVIELFVEKNTPGTKYFQAEHFDMSYKTLLKGSFNKCNGSQSLDLVQQNSAFPRCLQPSIAFLSPLSKLTKEVFPLLW